jgi:hypothetical protein
MVRARLRDHFDAYKNRSPELFGDFNIQVSAWTDYAYRLFVEKTLWMQVVAELASETDYDNFD